MWDPRARCPRKPQRLLVLLTEVEAEMGMRACVSVVGAAVKGEGTHRRHVRIKEPCDSLCLVLHQIRYLTSIHSCHPLNPQIRVLLPQFLDDSERAPGVQPSVHGEGVSSKAAQIVQTRRKHAQGTLPHRTSVLFIRSGGGQLFLLSFEFGKLEVDSFQKVCKNLLDKNPGRCLAHGRTSRAWEGTRQAGATWEQEPSAWFARSLFSELTCEPGCLRTLWCDRLEFA